NYDRIRRYRRLGSDVTEALFALKYRGVSIKREEDLFECAQHLADRIDIHTQLLDHLFAHRQDRSIARDVWETDVRTAFCIDHITSDRSSSSARGWVANFDRLIDEAAQDHFLGAIRNSK